MKKELYLKFILSFLLVFAVSKTRGQEAVLSHATISTAKFVGKSSPLKTLKIIKAEISVKDNETAEVINLENLTVNIENRNKPGYDHVVQSEMGNARTGGILQNFEGVGNLQNKLPPDTEGDVGIGHYIQMINMSFAIYNKSGDLLYGPASNLSLWQEAPEPWSSTSNGDPIVLYDEQADRWLLSELSFPNHPNGPYYIKIAISESNDPLGSWFLYGFEYDYFCDYPKLSVWNDGYYLTANNNEWVSNQWDFHAVGLSVFERDSMLVGARGARRIFYDFYPNQQPWSVLPADFDGQPPPANTPAYFAYLYEGSTDRIFIYKAITDWQNINNSTVGWMNNLLPEAFDDNLPDGIPQPESAPYLASLSNRLMYRLQYRHFDGYDCMVTNHTVNRGDYVAGIRWYELRNYGTGWEIFQQGTYSPDDTHRWMGSAAMDGYGNIAVGYSMASVHVYPSVGYSGRTKNAPQGELNVTEQIIAAGSGVQLNPNHRWGDYSAMSVDPTDQTTFWYTQQYYETSGDRSWQTRIAAFHINEFLGLDIEAETTILCQGNDTQLFAFADGGSGNYSFSWESNPPGFQSIEQNPTITPIINTTYFCFVNDGVTEIEDSIVIVVNPAPQVYAGPDTIICSNNILQISDATAENYTEIFWETSGDGNFDNPEIINPAYIPGFDDIETGSATLTLTASPFEGCFTASSGFELILDPCTFISVKRFEQEQIRIFPNPGKGEFNVSFIESTPKMFSLSIYNLKGKLMLKKEIRNPDKLFKVELQDLNNGVYLMELQSETLRFSKRVVINK